MIRALMVDVDGVLVHGRPDDGKSRSSSIEADLGLSLDDLQKTFFAPCWSDVVTGRKELVECLVLALKKINAQVSHHELIDYWFAHDARLDRSLIADLDRQREQGIKVCLATNQEHLRARYLIDQLGLERHTDGIYYSAAVGFRKPDPLFFRYVARSLSLPPKELLLLDDQAENVTAARGAGWQAVHWTPGRSLRGELATFESPVLEKIHRP